MGGATIVGNFMVSMQIRQKGKNTLLISRLSNYGKKIVENSVKGKEWGGDLVG